MQNVVDRCLTKSTNIIITGDLNLNLLDMRSESSPGMKLKNFMDIFDCQNMVRDPTCFAGNEPTSIHVIITNNGNKFAKTIACNTGLSDHHYMVASALKKHAPCVKNTDTTYRSYRNLNVDAFRQDVESIPFSVCNVFDDINDSHWAFNNEHIPIKSKRTRKHEAPFVNDEYRKAIRSKASSWHSYLRENAMKIGTSTDAYETNALHLSEMPYRNILIKDAWGR